MAPIDFEKELQKRSRSREIAPREQIWTRLSARLEREGPESRRGSRLWMVMAAASVVLLVGLVLFRETAGTVPSGIPLVRTPEVDIPTGVTPASEPNAFSDSPETEAESLAASRADQIQDRLSEKNENRVARRDEPQVSNQAATALLAETGETPLPETARQTGDLVPQVAIAEAESEQGAIPEAEIEALLKNARESIGLQNEPATPAPVDARDLLDKAEDELDQTFRARIMEKLKTGVAKFRTGVVNRDK